MASRITPQGQGSRRLPCDQCSWRNPCLNSSGIAHRVHRRTATNLDLSTLIGEGSEDSSPDHGYAARLNNQITPDPSMKIEPGIGRNREVMLDCASTMHNRVFAQPDRAFSPVRNLTHVSPMLFWGTALPPSQSLRGGGLL